MVLVSVKVTCIIISLINVEAVGENIAAVFQKTLPK